MNVLNGRTCRVQALDASLNKSFQELSSVAIEKHLNDNLLFHTVSKHGSLMLDFTE